jgi:hypothetical protein
MDNTTAKAFPESPATTPAASPSDPVDKSLYPHKDDKLATYDAKMLKRARWNVLGLCAIGAVAEAVIGYMVVLMITRDQFIAVLMSLSIVAIANYGLFTAGEQFHTNKKKAWGAVAFWAALGIALVAVRIVGSQYDAPAISVADTTDMMSAKMSAKAQADALVAVLLGTVYFLAGYATIVKVAGITNPQMIRMVKAKTLRDRLISEHETVLENSLQANSQVARRLAGIDDLATQRTVQHREIDADIAAAKELARQKAAELLGSPRTTGLVHDRPKPVPSHTPPSDGSEDDLDVTVAS